MEIRPLPMKPQTLGHFLTEDTRVPNLVVSLEEISKKYKKLSHKFVVAGLVNELISNEPLSVKGIDDDKIIGSIINDNKYLEFLKQELVKYLNKEWKQSEDYENNPKDRDLFEDFKTYFAELYNNSRYNYLNDESETEINKKNAIDEIIKWFNTYTCNLKYVEYNIIEKIESNDNESNEDVYDVYIVGYPDPKQMAPLIETGQLEEGYNNSIQTYKTFHKAVFGEINEDHELEDHELVFRKEYMHDLDEINDRMKELNIPDEIFHKFDKELKEKGNEIAKDAFSLPIFSLDYVFQIMRVKKTTNTTTTTYPYFGDAKMLYTSFRDIQDKHIEIFKKIRELVHTQLLQKFYPQVVDAQPIYNFECTMDMTKRNPYIKVKYVHPTSNFGTFAHTIHNSIHLDEIIYNLSLKKEFFQKVNYTFYIKEELINRHDTEEQEQNDMGLQNRFAALRGTSSGGMPSGSRSGMPSGSRSGMPSGSRSGKRQQPVPGMQEEAESGMHFITSIDNSDSEQFEDNLKSCKAKVVICNTLNNFHVDAYVVLEKQDKTYMDECYHICLKPNLKELYGNLQLNTKSLEELKKLLPKSEYLGDSYGRDESQCEKYQYLSKDKNKNTPSYKRIHFKKVNEDAYEKDLVKTTKWASPLVSQPLCTNFSDALKNLETDINDSSVKNKKLYNMYPIKVFKFLKSVLENLSSFRIPWNKRENEQKIINGNIKYVHVKYVHDEKILYLFKLDKDKPVIWIYSFKNINDEDENVDIDGVLRKIDNILNKKELNKKKLNKKIPNQPEELFTKDEIESLRYYNGLRTLYDIENEKELQDIYNTIITESKACYYDDKNMKMFQNKNDNYLYKNEERMDLYCNRIVNLFMGTFHVQILNPSQYKNPLYSDYTTIIANYRLVLLSNCIKNLRIASNYYSNYGNQENQEMRIISPVMLTPYISFKCY